MDVQKMMLELNNVRNTFANLRRIADKGEQRMAKLLGELLKEKIKIEKESSKTVQIRSPPQ
jgi:hypothetical protein